MRVAFLAATLGVAAAAAVACGRESNDAPIVDDGDAGEEGGGGAVLPAFDAGPVGPAGTGAKTGLPCDVQAILENRCIACHDGKTQFAMLSYNDLVAKAPSDPTKTVAQLSLARMKDAARPMPPPPAAGPEADEIKSFEDWIAAGTPPEAKACTDPPPDGGASADAGPRFDAGDGGDGGPACSSGTFWTMGNRESPLMYPGRACNACHQISGGPNLRIAGTVYPTLDEVDDCNGKGAPPQVNVVITAVDGKVYTLPVNGSGNFLLRGMNPKPPFKAVVTDGAKTRAMVGSVTSGDCNSCHTKDGKNGAPGRILTP